MTVRSTRFVGTALIAAALAGCGSKGTCQCFRGDGSSVNIETDGESCSEIPSAGNGFVSCEPVVPINSIMGPGTAIPSFDAPGDRGGAFPATATGYLERRD